MNRGRRVLQCAVLVCAFAFGVQAFAQSQPAGKCNADPTLSPDGLTVVSVLYDADTLRALLADDAALAQRLGNPTVSGQYAIDGTRYVRLGYPPLDDLEALARQVRDAGLFPYVEINGRFCFAPPPPDRIGRVAEFYNTRLDHYFYTADEGEAAAIRAGAVGPDWIITGQAFYVDVQPGCPMSTDTPVYRFAGIPGKGPSSHFFTRDRAECYAVKSSERWLFEGLPFWAAPLAGDGTCARPDMLPLHRIWRPFGETNHRFTTDVAIVAAMVDRGWVPEGPVMCVRGTPATG